MAPPEMCVVDNPRRIGGKSEMMDGVLCCDVLCCAVVCERVRLSATLQQEKPVQLSLTH